MITLRPILLPDDFPSLAAIDAGFETEYVYRVRRDHLSFRLEEVEVNPPLHNSYLMEEVLRELDGMDYSIAADVDGNVVGFAAAKFESWNRRAILWHLYVGREYRGAGVGRALLDSVTGFARSRDTRCLWVETQNINLPAVRFYMNAGFRFCGLDESLYDIPVTSAQETALFFALDL